MVQVNESVFDKSLRPFPGYYEIKEMTINNVDVTDQFLQFDHFESIFSVTSARLTMIDTRNLIKTIPIIGEEVVKVRIGDGVNEMVAQFRVYAITDRVAPNHNTLRYVLHLASEEMYADSFVRVSKSYYKKKLEDNVTDIIKGPNYLQSPKTVLIGETDEAQCIVVPYWSPLHALNWMASRARSADLYYNGGTFVFYETMTGFKWLALENLFDSEKNKVYATLRYDPMRPLHDGLAKNDERTRTDVLSLENWKISKSFNVMENAREGMYANRATVVDIVNRDYTDHEYNYLEQFNAHTHLKGMSGANAQPLCSKQMSAVGFPEAHIRVVLKHKGLFNDEPEGNSRIEEWMPGKISQYQQIDNFVIQGEMPGHLGIEAGMIVQYDAPNPQDVSINKSPGADTDYSGEYLVTSLRRMFTRDSFSIHFEMAKDSRGVDPKFVGGR